MPVIEHEVHELTRIPSNHRYGCWGGEKHLGYFAPTRRYFPDGRFEMINVWIENRMSKDCRFDMSLSDPSCTGCKHRGSGENYAESIRIRGS